LAVFAARLVIVRTVIANSNGSVIFMDVMTG